MARCKPWNTHTTTSCRFTTSIIIIFFCCNPSNSPRGPDVPRVWDRRRIYTYICITIIYYYHVHHIISAVLLNAICFYTHIYIYTEYVYTVFFSRAHTISELSFFFLPLVTTSIRPKNARGVRFLLRVKYLFAHTCVSYTTYLCVICAPCVNKT